jgi:hypothetical protein
MRRVRLFAVLAIASTGALVFALVGRSGAGPRFDVINGTVTAGADHVSAGNDAFPNFGTGAVDNRYPLANAHIDNLASQGYGSIADTGPIGQTAAANGQKNFTQPQYASAKYPPKPQTVTVGHPPVAYATAHASENNASTDAAIARSAGPATSSKARSASIDRLNSALLSWRHEFLTADDNARYPFVAGKASEPDGGDGLTALTTSNFDDNAGLLTVEADSRVDHASFGGGTILFDNVHTDVTITNDGTPAPKITIEVGKGSVGGVPVTVGAEGVSVAGTAVPGTAGASEQANAALNQALASAGFHVFALAPAITKGQNMTSVEATALRVRWRGGDIAPGVPASFIEHDLGEAFAFSLAVPSAVLPTIPTAVGAATGAAPTTIFIPGTAPIPGSPGTSGTGGGYAMPSPQTQALPATRAVAEKPLWLLLLYFAWQSSIIGAAASLWYWRAEAA